MEILYEDNHIIVVNKAIGEIVQADNTGDLPLEEMVREYIRVKYNKPGAAFLGVVHRIDRPVSGIVLMARTSKALARLNEMMAAGAFKKTYLAIVKNKPDPSEGRLENLLVRNTKTNKSYITQKPSADAKNAILNYRVVCSSDRYHLLEVGLITGRHHQIRCQLANIQSPIKGDLKYGAERSNPDGGICLHSYRLEFVHPVQNVPVVFEAAPPAGDPLWKYFYNQLKEEK